MNKLIDLLAKLNNWKYKLYLLINENVERLSSKYQIGNKESDEILTIIFLSSLEFISCDKQKYLIVNNDNLIPKEKSRAMLLHNLLVGDETKHDYELNKKEINILLHVHFIYPLVKEMELKEQISHEKRVNSLLHKELDKDNSVDRRKTKRKCDDYIKEFFENNKNYDKSKNNTELAKEIRKWIKGEYSAVNFSDKTIRPKLSILRN